jgi:acylphosphatase
MQHREVLFFGHVQGVGFRYTARQIASRFAVTGYVVNLRDGSVRVVVEGADDQIDGFLGALNNEMERYIRSTEVHTAAATGDFIDFSIRH